MHVPKAYQNKKLPQYVEAILKCSEKKTCSNLANELGITHDKIYRNFNLEAANQDLTISNLIKLAGDHLSQNKRYLIFDDTQINKQYAQDIEGLDIGFDSSAKKAILGLKMVTALLTDTNIKIPIDTEAFITKHFAQSSYKTKTEIALEIYELVSQFSQIDMVLADAHFATEKSISFFNAINQQYLMKIPRNRKVTLENKNGQLKQVLKLKRNQRYKFAQGFFKEIPCYFYVIKIKNNTTVYFVSNDYINPKSIVEIYRIRWNIEMFHRTAKQKLGLGDCQMRSLEKQRQHVLFVMHTYAIADIYRFKFKFKNIEEAIKHLRTVKFNGTMLSIILTGANLC